MKALARFLLIACTSCVLFLAVQFELDSKKQRQVAEGPIVTARVIDSDGNHLPVAGQQEPEVTDGIVLDAPDLAEVGELVRFDASDSTVNLTWQILPHTDDFEVIEGGKRAFFSSRVTGSYLVIIAGAKDDTPFLQHFTIVVEGDEVAPGPATLATKVASWVRRVEDYDAKADDGRRLAANFRKIAIATEVDIDQILKDTAVGNSAALGDNQDKWVPFLEELGAELDAYIDAGELETREHYRNTWLQIAKGIEKGVPRAKLVAPVEPEQDAESDNLNDKQE